MTANITIRQAPLSSDPLSKLPTGQVREMREAFEILDHDNDGQVTRDDVVDMLTNLGQFPNLLLLSPPSHQSPPPPTFLPQFPNR